MEIILALMALAATPFGVAMLDKPTRKRFVKFAKSHDPRATEEFVGFPRRVKNWEQDKALQTLWEECFKLYSLPQALQNFDYVLMRYREEQGKLEVYRIEADRTVKAYEACSYFDVRLYDEKDDAKRRFWNAKAEAERMFNRSEKELIELAKKYDVNNLTELRYKHDMLRHTATKEFNYGVDFLALTQ